jgi:hypothetical protein
MAWTSTIVDDLDGALRAASVSLEQLRGQDEPFWTALALDPSALWRRPWAATMTLLATRPRCATWRRGLTMPGSPPSPGWTWAPRALVRGRLEEARALLEEALGLSLAARSTRSVTLCLAAFAQLAFAEGDTERAALLAGTAEGVRRRVGLGCGRRCGAGRPTWWPRYARRWGRTGSRRCSPRAPG